jgi:hypothetical protein
MLFPEGFLQRMQLGQITSGRQALDGGDFMPIGLDSKHDARAHSLSI